MLRAVLLALCLPVAAQAACKGVTLVSCPVGGGDVLEVCSTGSSFTYAFGPPAAPELRLSVPMSSGPVQPWPGVGSAIWSSVGFPNAGYTYEVWISVERSPDATGPEAGVNVLQGDSIIADFVCDGGEIADPFRLQDEMYEAGYCWNYEGFAWRSDGKCD
jgi:hypothetical protein